MLQYADLIHIAPNVEVFASCCEAALGDLEPERTAARIEEGRKSSWDARVAQMMEVLEKRSIF